MTSPSETPLDLDAIEARANDGNRMDQGGNPFDSASCPCCQRAMTYDPNTLCDACLVAGLEGRYPHGCLRDGGRFIDLDVIEALADAATAGPWVAVSDDDQWLRLGDITNSSEPGSRIVICEDAGTDAEFIAHARQDVPALVAEVKRLRAERDGLGDHQSRGLWEAQQHVADLQHELRAVRRVLAISDAEVARLHDEDDRPRTVGDLTARDLGRRVRIDGYRGGLRMFSAKPEKSLVTFFDIGSIWMATDAPVEFLDDEPANGHQKPGERLPSHEQAAQVLGGAEAAENAGGVA